VPAAIVIARATILEAARRRLLLALVLLTVIVIAGTGWGFDKLWSIRTGRGGALITATEVRLVSAGLLILVTFMFSAVLALSSVLVASPAISGEVESGQALAILSRPIRRSDVVLGKWLGLGFLVVCYAIGSGVAELAVVSTVTGYTPPDPVQLTAYVGAEGLVLLSLALLLSTQLSGMTGGVIALVLYFMTWLSGIVGGIGTALQNSALSDVGIVGKLVLPTDGLWRGAVYAMEPSSFRAAARAAGAAGAANPFSAADAPATTFLVWTVVWVVLVMAITVALFNRKEI
jgi:ABC-type transport system involved in multi-copper enzyme maturation permease subunit